MSELDKFPPQYGELFMKAVLDGAVIVSLPTRHKAVQLRASLHAYRRTLREAEIQNNARLAELALLIDTVIIKLVQAEGRTHELRLYKKQETMPLTAYVDKALQEKQP